MRCSTPRSGVVSAASCRDDPADRDRVYARSLAPGGAVEPRRVLELAFLLEADGGFAEEEAIYTRAVASRDEDIAPRAAYSLGRLLERHGDHVGARTAYRFALDSGHWGVNAEAASALQALPANESG